MPANNKDKFIISGLRGRLVKSNSFQVEGKLTSLHISRINTLFRNFD